MKKIYTLFIVGIILIGCGEKKQTVDYYYTHINEAEKLQNECIKNLSESDKVLMMKFVMNDPEVVKTIPVKLENCVYADIAISKRKLEDRNKATSKTMGGL